MTAPRILQLVQALSILALAVVLMFPRARWSQRIRLPVALVAFAASAGSLFSRIL